MARELKAKKVYVSSTETEGKRSYFADATGLEFRFANGETVAVDPNGFSDTVRTAAMFHGFSQKLGDAYATSKDADEAYDKFMSLKERLEAGEWIAEGESAGPRISMVILAIVAAKAAAGQTVTESEVAEKYHAMDKERQKALMEDPRIKAAYEALRAEAAAERARKAAAKAEGEAGGFAI